MERDYLLEKYSRIICENENRVYVNQRDVAREDNHRLNLLVENFMVQNILLKTLT